MNLYDELELTPNCTFEEIKQQYRTLASKHHPDHGGDAERFKRIKFAYEVLSDPDRRKEYDENKTTSTVHTSIRQEAITELAKLFFSIIPNFDCRNGNLIETMKHEVNQMKTRVSGDSTMNETFIGNLEVLKDKLRLKNQDDENILLSFVLQQLENRYKDKTKFTHVVELAEEMLIILDMYNYGFLEIVE